MTVQPLPPKMAQQFAKRARDGEADYQHGNSLWLFYQGANEICLFNLDHPFGHIKRQTPAEQASRLYGKTSAP